MKAVWIILLAGCGSEIIRPRLARHRVAQFAIGPLVLIAIAGLASPAALPAFATRWPASWIARQ